MQNFDPSEHPHRRRNPLTGKWVQVSPHRMRRPWRGQVEKRPSADLPEYDSGCYLCPGNQRTSGEINDKYQQTFVFQNDFASLLADPPEIMADDNPLMQFGRVTGTCRVMCFSPKHHLTLPQMSTGEIAAVVERWVQQSDELGQRHKWVQIFENKGAMMGCSNPHPHCQIWGVDSLPTEALLEDHFQKAYFEEHGRQLLVDYTQRELSVPDRIVVENQSWLVVVPFWAEWPFETLLLPKRQLKYLTDLSADEKQDLAQILQTFLIRYDNLFETSFPYSMGWHQAPFTSTTSGQWQHWTLHAHFYPPLLRSATVKKFMVGYEMLGEAQRDLTPEQAAERLRSVSSIHYTQP